LCGLGTQSGAVIVLIDLVNWEVLGIDVRLEFRLERRPNTTQTVPLNTAEEVMLFDLVCTVSTT
jgi:hypothetical protein